jgi:hypothetical protein
MKSVQIRWAGVILAYLAYNAAWLWFYHDHADSADILWLVFTSQSAIMLVALLALFRPRLTKDPRTPLVAAVLAVLTAASSAKGAEPPIELLSVQAAQENGTLPAPHPLMVGDCRLWGGLIGGAVVIGIGVGASYCFWRMCHLTNNNLSGGPAPFAGPRKPPVSGTNTNNVVVTTNAQTRTSLPLASVTADAAWPTGYNPWIATNDWQDPFAPPGTPFTAWMVDTNLQVSSDLSGPWQTCSVNAWVSQNGCLSVTCLGDDPQLMATNYVIGNPFGGEWASELAVPLPGTAESGARRFFRYAVQ